MQKLVSFPQTLDEIQQTLDAVPNLGIAHLYLSKCLLYQNSPCAARVSYNKAITLNPELKDTAHWFNIEDALCSQYIGAGQIDKAATVCKRAVCELEREDKGDPLLSYYIYRFHTILGALYHKKGKMDESIAAYEKALAEIKGMLRGKINIPDYGKIHKTLETLYRKKRRDQKSPTP